MTDEKKDDPAAEKGDKGHEREKKEEKEADHTPGQKSHSSRGGHRRREGGNPDASN